MQAIILAAGMGKRLKHLTENNTKCMVKVNGISIIERTLRILDRKALNKIVIVVGYEGQKLVNYHRASPHRFRQKRRGIQLYMVRPCKQREK